MTTMLPALSPETVSEKTAIHEELMERHSAHNYHPLPVVIADAEGAWVTDVDGRRYLDFLAGYSALNFGHRHPGLIAAAHAQLDRVTLTSRAFVHDQFGEFCHETDSAIAQLHVGHCDVDHQVSAHLPERDHRAGADDVESNFGRRPRFQSGRAGQ